MAQKNKIKTKNIRNGSQSVLNSNCLRTVIHRRLQPCINEGIRGIEGDVTLIGRPEGKSNTFSVRLGIGKLRWVENRVYANIRALRLTSKSTPQYRQTRLFQSDKVNFENIKLSLFHWFLIRLANVRIWCTTPKKCLKLFCRTINSIKFSTLQ